MSEKEVRKAISERSLKRDLFGLKGSKFLIDNAVAAEKAESKKAEPKKKAPVKGMQPPSAEGQDDPKKAAPAKSKASAKKKEV